VFSNIFTYSFKCWTFSVIFTWILGTILHFTYDWSNQNAIVGVFSAINESTWEHLKLLFFPMLITTIIGYFYIGKKIPDFLCAKTCGIVGSMLFVIVFFYTYTGVIGRNFSFLDIGSFFVAVLLGEYVAYKIITSVNTNFKCDKNWAIIILTLLFMSFVIFTYFTPQIGLFKDPIENVYGILK